MAARLVLGCLIIGIVLATAVQAQESQWQNLAQVKRGTKIQVVERSLKSTSGRFLRVSETDLTLKVDRNEVVVPRNQVYRVSVSGKNRKRNMLIGLAAGAAAGVALGAAIMERENGYAAAVAGSTVGFAGIGTGIGAAVPAAKTVYRAELPNNASLTAQSHRGLRF